MALFDWLKPVEFDKSGNIVKDKSKKKKAPAKKKKASTGRTTKQDRDVKMFLQLITGVKYELDDVADVLSAKEKRAAITTFNKYIRVLEK